LTVTYEFDFDLNQNTFSFAAECFLSYIFKMYEVGKETVGKTPEAHKVSESSFKFEIENFSKWKQDEVVEFKTKIDFPGFDASW
jgi:hypothetical protein